jgi:hypothetical protein
MKRITVLVASVLALVGLSAAAHAKPKVAVLGLEVIDNGAVDKKATQAAQGLAEELRAQASLHDGKFELAPHSAKDLLELKLLSDCGDEGRTCMAAIGKDLGADRLLYGKIERRKTGYQVSLKLLNTNTKAMEKTTSELIPEDDLHTTKITRWSRSLYSRLIGVPESGNLRLDANVDKATIYVDGKVATTLRAGSAKVVGLEEGVHKVAIEADGYKRYEADVAITAGSTEELSVSMISAKSGGGGGSSESDPGKIWQIAFYSGAIVTAGMGLGWTYYGVQAGYLGDGGLINDKESTWATLQSENPTAVTEIADAAGMTSSGVINDSCGHTSAVSNKDAAYDAFVKACKDGEAAADRATYAAVGTAIFGLATAYFGYQTFVVHGGKSKERQARNKKKGSTIVVAPQVSPDSIGAGLSLEF